MDGVITVFTNLTSLHSHAANGSKPDSVFKSPERGSGSSVTLAGWSLVKLHERNIPQVSILRVGSSLLLSCALCSLFIIFDVYSNHLNGIRSSLGWEPCVNPVELCLGILVASVVTSQLFSLNISETWLLMSGSS